MRVLIIKTSSMGDIIHTLPALTDAGKMCSDIHFDWVVEESFAEIPRWHPLVDQVIPVAIRRWRKNLFNQTVRQEIQQFCERLRATNYDLIIDAQGLFKTLWISLLAKGPVCGLDRQSAREPFTSFFYTRKYPASWKLHAVTRIRLLFSQALGYTVPETVADYGVDRKGFIDSNGVPDYLVFLHGTTWPTKHWPEQYWIELANVAAKNGLKVKLPWGNDEERKRAERIAANNNHVEILPKLTLMEMAKVLASAKTVVAVDTGLGHLAAALNVPTVSLYGPTDPALVGAMGQLQIHLSAKFACAPCSNRDCTYRGTEPKTVEPPCFVTVQPEEVWRACESLLVKGYSTF